MNEEIKQIAERLRGLRDALEISPAEMAESCGISEEDFLKIESGDYDIPVNVLHQIAQHYGVELSTLMFGSEPHMNSYFLTRKGQGKAVERVQAYKYQSLAAGFMDRKADPFIVTVEPKSEEEPMHLNSHPGQEFNLVLEGRILLQINGKDLILETGDSLYFNSILPHGMRALDGKPVRFLAVIL